MDFSILQGDSIKIRTKGASFVTDPVESIAKTNADAVILLSGTENIDLSRVSDYRVVVRGEGEYEINGVKILGVSQGTGFVYNIFADNMEVILGRASDLSKIKDKSLSSQIVFLNVDGELKSIVAKLEPRVVVLYGEKKLEGAKELRSDSAKPVSKFTISKDKLPAEMEVTVL